MEVVGAWLRLRLGSNKPTLRGPEVRVALFISRPSLVPTWLPADVGGQSLAGPLGPRRGGEGPVRLFHDRLGALGQSSGV